MAKRANAVSEYGMVSGIHRYVFPDGSKVEFDPTRCPEALATQFQTYGQKVKCDRFMALGQSATWQEKKAALVDGIAQLYAGDWSAQAGSLVVQAMLNLYPNRFASARAVREWIDERAENAKCKPAAIIADLESQPKVRDEIIRLRPRGDVERGNEILGELES